MADPVPSVLVPDPVSPVSVPSLSLGKLVAIVVAAVLSTLFATVGIGALCAAWWLHVPQPTPPAISVPHDVPAMTGRIVSIQAQTRGDKVTWRSIAGPDTPDLLVHDAREVHFVAPVVGDYRVLATTVLNEEPVSDECTVHVGPYTPGPGPGPVPPTPTDPLTKAMQAAYDEEVAADKAKAKESLAAMYEQAAATTVKLAELKTAGDLYTRLHSAADQLVGPNGLPKVRQTIADELKANLPTAVSAPLDDTTRNKCSSEFAKVAKALETVK